MTEKKEEREESRNAYLSCLRKGYLSRGRTRIREN